MKKYIKIVDNGAGTRRVTVGDLKKAFENFEVPDTTPVFVCPDPELMENNEYYTPEDIVWNTDINAVLF